MTIYIAGKITGDPEYKTKFAQAERQLRKLFGTVLNPAVLPEGMGREDYMQICFSMIARADAVAFLPGWTSSPGATLEHQYCAYVGKEILYLENN